MNNIVLNQERMESLKILLYEVITQKHAAGKSTSLMDLSPRIPKEITNDEFDAVVNELAKAGYAEFEPGLGVRARFKPGPRISMWQNEYSFDSKKVISTIDNKITIEKMINSQIQQGTRNSSQIFTLKSEENATFEKLVRRLKEEAATISLSPEDQKDLNFQISTLENQVKSTRKNKGIIAGAIETVTDIIESAAGSGLWAILAELNKFL